MNLPLSKNPRLYLLLFVISISAILAVKIISCQNTGPADQKLISLADRKMKNLTNKTGHHRGELHRIDFISYDDKDGEIKPVTIKSLSFDMASEGFDPNSGKYLRPLIQNQNKDRYFFFNNTNNIGYDTLLFFEVVYDKASNKILIKDEKNVNNLLLLRDHYTCISYDSNTNEVLLNNLTLIDVNNGNETLYFDFLGGLTQKHYDKLSFDDKKITGLEVQNTLQITNNIFIVQMSGYYGGRKSLFNSINCLAKVTRGKTDLEITRVGYYPVLWPAFENRLFSPLDVSPNKKQVAFLASYSPDSKNELYLFTLDLDSFETRKIIEIDMDPSGLREGLWTKFMFSPRNLKWCPASNSNIVAVHSVGELLIIDISHKKNIKRFQRNVRLVNMRWNKKGDKLGILENDGVLSVYDLKTGTIKKIAKDTDYFDLLWVP